MHDSIYMPYISFFEFQNKFGYTVYQLFRSLNHICDLLRSINTSKSSQFKLSNSQTFSITDESALTKLAVTNAGINVQCPLSMNTYQLSGIPIPLNPDQCPNKLYVDTSITNLNINSYLTSASAVSTYATLTSLASTNLNVANLVNTTQNLSATSSLTTSIKPLDMGVNKITSSYSPLNPTDLTNKNYVDVANGLKLNISGGTLSGTGTTYNGSECY